MAENVFAVTQSGFERLMGRRVIWGDGARFRGKHLIYPSSRRTPGAIVRIVRRMLPNHQVCIVSDGDNQ